MGLTTEHGLYTVSYSTERHSEIIAAYDITTYELAVWRALVRFMLDTHPESLEHYMVRENFLDEMPDTPDDYLERAWWLQTVPFEKLWPWFKKNIKLMPEILKNLVETSDSYDIITITTINDENKILNGDIDADESMTYDIRNIRKLFIKRAECVEPDLWITRYLTAIQNTPCMTN